MKNGTPRGTHRCTLKRETATLAKVCKQYTLLAKRVLPVQVWVYYHKPEPSDLTTLCTTVTIYANFFT